MSPGRPAWGQPRARWWGETPSDRCRREGRLRGDGGGEQSRLDEKGPPSPATVGFTRPIFPGGDPGSPAAFLGGGMGRGWSADSGPGSLAASSCPAVDWLAVCPRAGYTPRSLSFLKQGLRTQSQSTPQVSAKRAPAITKFETLCACPYPLSPGRPCPSFYAGAVDWAAVPFTYTSSGFGANATHGRAGWESRRCGGEYDFVKIILEAIRGAIDQNHGQPPGIPRGRTGDGGRREPLARELDGSIA